MIITIGIEKGGTGKSTTATNLACYISSLGKEVVILDADIQKTASDWMSIREEQINDGLSDIKPIDVFAQNKEVDKVARRLSKKYEHVIIDVGGQADRSLGLALMCSNVLYMPVRPSQADLWTLDKMESLLENVKGVNPGIISRAFLNQAPTNPGVRETGLAKKYLQEFDNIQLSDYVVCERKSFRDAMLNGLSVFNMKDDKAISEMRSLCNEILSVKEV